MRQTAHALRLTSLCLFTLLSITTRPAHAGAERQLVEAINDYRAHPQRCERRPAQRLSPLTLKSNLALPIGYGGGLRDRLKASGYQAVTVRSLRVVGAQDAEEAFDLLQSDYCSALLDSQYADIGVSRSRSEWQVVLARPVLDSQMNDARAVSKALTWASNALLTARASFI